MRNFRLPAAITLAACLGAGTGFSALSTADSEFTGQYRLQSNNGLAWTDVVEFPSHLQFQFPQTTYSPSGNTNWTWSQGTQITLYKGDCANSACTNNSHPVVWNGVVSGDIATNIGPLNPAMVFGSNGFLNAPELKSACNQLISQDADAIYTTHNLNRDIKFTLRLNGTQTTNGPTQAGDPVSQTLDTKRVLNIPTNIVCQAVGNNPGPINGEELKVFLATSSNAVTQPTPGVHCPRTKATVRLKTNRAGTLPVLLHKKIGNGAAQVKQVDIVSTRQNDGSYLGRFEEWISIDQTQVVAIKAVEKDNPYITNDTNLATEWEDISLVCSGVSGGGLQTTGTNTSPGTPGPRRNPTLPATNNDLQMLPNHTGGGGRPTGLQNTAPVIPSQSAPVRNAGLRSDGELVQAVSEKPAAQTRLPKPVVTPPNAARPAGAVAPIGVPNPAANKDSHDRYGNMETSSMPSNQNPTTQSRPTLFQGKIGDQCRQVPGMRHQPNLVLKRGLLQVYVECKNNRITEVRGKTVNPQWRQGDPVQAPAK